MRRFIPLLSAAALIGGLSWTSTAAAGPGGGPGGGPGMHGKRFERALEEAGLAPETEAQVRSILEEARRAHRPMREQIGAARKQLHDLLGAEEVDATAVVAQADTLGTLMGQAQRMRAATLLQVRGVVTAEEWKTLRGALEDTFRGRRGGGPKGPGGKGQGQGGRGPWAE